MNVQVHAKDITLQSSTRAHIESAIESFKKYSLEITSVNVHVQAEKKGVSIEFDIHVAHAKPVVISQVDDNLDAAIDLAIDRATTALRRLHEKIVSHKSTGMKDLEILDN
ncbi:ribosome hibernation-promoting factor, HPF/YfiA family [Candidatus Sulfurimonas baltica]|uniref:Ribosome-associated translation inhibitor RaiA n=1 Tax=Candidatus Sulfurimonas baltica TaxID=2740404 RepID=A0A7S7LUE2_9BACT|nr:ribosome-associated translation inhibitor RaiA [Candidatus Sulfurimonas baltica]QOY51647.1 ribosome-associated translation inhibitor RaiA [Candidatus Sulfurimonas baltica]